MKYIRTRDGIFRIDNDKISIIDDCQFVSIRGGILHALNVKDKVADTIEELCDEFVYRKSLIKIDFKKMEYEDYNELCAWRPIISDMFIGGIYGAIWTDKGLIYVAKMNTKGDLELL